MKSRPEKQKAKSEGGSENYETNTILVLNIWLFAVIHTATSFICHRDTKTAGYQERVDCTVHPVELPRLSFLWNAEDNKQAPRAGH